MPPPRLYFVERLVLIRVSAHPGVRSDTLTDVDLDRLGLRSFSLREAQREHTVL